MAMAVITWLRTTTLFLHRQRYGVRLITISATHGRLLPPITLQQHTAVAHLHLHQEAAPPRLVLHQVPEEVAVFVTG